MRFGFGQKQCAMKKCHIPVGPSMKILKTSFL